MPTVLNYPGVYIEELPSAVRTITGVPTSIAAFVGRAWKGPIDQPVTVNSLADYERMFGGLWVGSSMSYAIAQFFANGGGQAIVVRVVNRTEAAGTAATTTKFAINGGTKLEASSPGTWGNNLSLTVDTTANPDLPPDPGRFHLTVLDSPDRKEDSAKRGGSGAQESYPNVSITPTSPRYLLRVLAEQSKLIRVQDGLAANVGGSAPAGNATVTNTAPNAGRDGSDIATNDVKGASGAGTGMYALSRADLFNLLCLPPPTVGGDHDTGLWTDAAAFCKGERAVVLVDAVRTWDVATAATAVVAAPFGNIADKSNAALYFPRLRMPDALAENALTDFAPCGVVAGVISRTDTARGVWKAPAGIEASVGGVFGTSVNGQPTTLIDADSGTLNPVAVNVHPRRARRRTGRLGGADDATAATSSRRSGSTSPSGASRCTSRRACIAGRSGSCSSPTTSRCGRRSGSTSARSCTTCSARARSRGHAAGGVPRQVRQARRPRRTTSTAAS